jgi:hypothetical protein
MRTKFYNPISRPLTWDGDFGTYSGQEEIDSNEGNPCAKFDLVISVKQEIDRGDHNQPPSYTIVECLIFISNLVLISDDGPVELSNQDYDNLKQSLKLCVVWD